MLNVPLRNKNKSKQFTKKIKLTSMTNVHVNKCACHHRPTHNHNNIILHAIYEQYET